MGIFRQFSIGLLALFSAFIEAQPLENALLKESIFNVEIEKLESGICEMASIDVLKKHIDREDVRQILLSIVRGDLRQAVVPRRC